MVELDAKNNLTDYDGLVLTLEGNARKFPPAVLRMIKSQLKTCEERLLNQPEHRVGRIIGSPLANALCVTAVKAGEAMKAVAYLVPTETGLTPRLMAQFRQSLPIIAVSPNNHVIRQLRLVRGVQPLITRRTLNHEDVLPLVVDTALKANCLHEGDAIVGIISGIDVSHAGNTVSLMVVGDIILRGQGIGGGIITGRVSVIKSLFDMKKSVKDRILVISATDAEHIKLIEEAAGLIVEEGGLSSHAAIACLSLGKPVIVGANDATELLLEDEQVTVDVLRGTVYRGWVNLG
jgi:pyruvate kinase